MELHIRNVSIWLILAASHVTSEYSNKIHEQEFHCFSLELHWTLIPIRARAIIGRGRQNEAGHVLGIGNMWMNGGGGSWRWCGRHYCLSHIKTHHPRVVVCYDIPDTKWLAMKPLKLESQSLRFMMHMCKKRVLSLSLCMRIMKTRSKRSLLEGRINWFRNSAINLKSYAVLLPNDVSMLQRRWCQSRGPTHPNGGT